jgi:HSP20 family protein
MLMRFDPFRDLDRLTQGSCGNGRQTCMPMDAYRRGDQVIVHFDLPGVDPASIDVTVEKDVLMVKAERRWEPREDDQLMVSERSQGRFTRQLFLGEGLDGDRIEARYDNGVLTLCVPVAEQAKPRKVEITAGNGTPPAIETESAAA